MEYETGVFKRYIRNRTDKDGNKKEVTQVGVSGLSVNSKFEDNEEIILLSKDDLTQLRTKIQNLENQLGEAKAETESLKNATPEGSTETPKYSNKVIELQELINNRNQLLFNTQLTINHIINEVTTEYYNLDKEVTQANESTKENISTLISELQGISKTLIEYDKEIQTQVNGINSSIDKTSWFKWIRSKNKFKIVLDTDKLKQIEVQLQNFNNTDTLQKAKEVLTPVEIPTDNLEKLTAGELDLNELFIPIGNDNSENEILVTQPEADNGNDN